MTALAQLKKLESYVTTYGDDWLIAASLTKSEPMSFEKVIRWLEHELQGFVSD